jgi:hypothetical protein
MASYKNFTSYILQVSPPILGGLQTGDPFVAADTFPLVYGELPDLK